MDKEKEMSKSISVFLLVFVCLSALPSWADEFPFEDYLGMRAHLGELFEQGELQQAADLLEEALSRFPDHLAANAFNMAYINGQLGNTPKGLEAMNYAHEQGVWFNVFGLQGPAFEAYQGLPEFKIVVKRNEAMRQQDQATAEPGLKVVLPEDYSGDSQYPLFIALHGGGGNMEAFSETWQSTLLGREFIIAYLQSSRLVSMTGYSWMEDIEISRREITEAYERLLEQYLIDAEQVIAGGFSAGGVAALEVMLANDIPLQGFVVLCPPLPEGFKAPALEQATQRGVRGTLMTTEMDPNIDAQQDMAAMLKSAALPHQFIVTPDVGHWIPDNLGEMVDSAIVHIRGR